MSGTVLPEVEGGVQVLRRTLLILGYPIREVQNYAEVIRRDQIPEDANDSAGFKLLDQLVHATHELELEWATLAPGSEVEGLSLAAANLRARCGVSVVAIAQNGEVATNPGPETTLHSGDRVALIGSPARIAAAEQLLQLRADA